MELCQWILEMHNLHLPVQRKHVQRKAMALIQPTHAGFKACAGWLEKFLKRHSITLRPQTFIQQKLPAQLEGKLTSFLRDIKALRTQHRFLSELIMTLRCILIWQPTAPLRNEGRMKLLFMVQEHTSGVSQ